MFMFILCVNVFVLCACVCAHVFVLCMHVYVSVLVIAITTSQVFPLFFNLKILFWLACFV